MPGNSFGSLFRVTTFGESHGGAVGVVVDGCPPGFAITKEDIQKELDRRKQGKVKLQLHARKKLHVRPILRIRVRQVLLRVRQVLLHLLSLVGASRLPIVQV